MTYFNNLSPCLYSSIVSLDFIPALLTSCIISLTVIPIASAALSALPLLAAIVEATSLTSIDILKAPVLVGLIIGGAIPFLFSAYLMNLIEQNEFDMIFIDADKMNYKQYYEKSLELIKKGGLIIIDNVLWHGEVADEKNNDKFTINIREFNKFVNEDSRVEQIIMPLGDGMTICRVL